MPKKFAEEKAKQKEAERALAAEQARQAQLAAEREREIAAEQARQAEQANNKPADSPTDSTN